MTIVRVSRWTFVSIRKCWMVLPFASENDLHYVNYTMFAFILEMAGFDTIILELPN